MKQLDANWKDCDLDDFADLNPTDLEVLVGCVRFCLNNPTSDSTNVDREILELLLAKLIVNRYCTVNA